MKSYKILEMHGDRPFIQSRIPVQKNGSYKIEYYDTPIDEIIGWFKLEHENIELIFDERCFKVDVSIETMNKPNLTNKHLDLHFKCKFNHPDLFRIYTAACTWFITCYIGFGKWRLKF